MKTHVLRNHLSRVVILPDAAHLAVQQSHSSSVGNATSL